MESTREEGLDWQFIGIQLEGVKNGIIKHTLLIADDGQHTVISSWTDLIDHSFRLICEFDLEIESIVGGQSSSYIKITDISLFSSDDKPFFSRS